MIEQFCHDVLLKALMHKTSSVHLNAHCVNADSIRERRTRGGKKTPVGFHLERVVDFLVSGVGLERVVPDGALHLSETEKACTLLPSSSVLGSSKKDTRKLQARS